MIKGDFWMESNFVAVTVPGSQNIPLHHLAEDPPSFFTGQIEDKGSTILKIARYIIMTVNTLLPSVMNINTVTSLQKSLNNELSFETLLTGDSTGENFINGLVEIQQVSKHPERTINKIARVLLLQFTYAINKADSVLCAIDNLGLPSNLASKSLHGLGYLASLGLATKHLLEVTESVEKQQISLIKKAEFGISAAAAIVGFFTLFSSATPLAMASISIGIAAALLSMADHFYESSVKKEDPEKTSAKYFLAVPKFQMV